MYYMNYVGFSFMCFIKILIISCPCPFKLCGVDACGDCCCYLFPHQEQLVSLPPGAQPGPARPPHAPPVWQGVPTCRHCMRLKGTVA